MKTRRPSRKLEIEEFVLGDERILFEPHSGTVNYVNASAGIIWSLCDGSSTVAEIASSLAGVDGMEFEAIQRDVEAALEGLARSGLIEPSASSANGFVVTNETSPFLTHLAFESSVVRISSDCSEVQAAIEGRFSHFISAPGRRAGCRLHVRRTEEGYSLVRQGIMDYRFRDLGELFHRLNQEIVAGLIQGTEDLLWFHAGAACSKSGAFVFMGPTGCGKSSIVKRLCADGWKYLCEDVLPFDPATRLIRPFPLPISARKPAREPVTDPATLSKEDVPWRHLVVATGGCPLSAIVLPRFRHGDPTSVRRLSPASGALEMIRHCLNLDMAGSDAVRFVCGITATHPIWKARYSNLSDLYEAVVGIESAASGQTPCVSFSSP